MPRIRNAQQRVESRALQAPLDRTSTANNLGQIGQAVAQAGQTIGAAVQDVRDRSDAAAVMRAEADLKFKLESKLRGEGGILGLKGQQALDASEGFYKDVTAEHAKIASSLNERQRSLFLQRTEQDLNAGRLQVEGHIRGQRDFVEAEAFKARADAGVASAIGAYDQPAVLGQELSRLDGVLTGEAKRRGLDAEGAAGFKAEVRRQALGGITERYVDSGNRLAGEMFLEQHKAELGPHAEKYARAFKHMADAETSQAAVATVSKAARVEGTPWLDPLKADEELAKAVEGKDPETVKAVRAGVEHAVSRNQALRSQAVKEKATEALAVYQQAGTLNTKAMAPIKAWLTDPKNGGNEEWQKLEDYDERKRKAALAERKGDKSAAAEARREQREVNELARRNWLLLPDEEKLAPLKSPPPGVDPMGFAGLQLEQQRFKRDWDKDRGLGRSEFLDLVDGHAQKLGYKKQNLADLRDAMLLAREEWASKPGNERKEPTKADVLLMLGDQLEIGDKGGLHLSKNKRRYQVQAGEDFEAFPDNEQDVSLSMRAAAKTPERPPVDDGKAAKPVDPYAKTRATLKPGQILIRRNGILGKIPSAELDPKTDVEF